MQIILYTQTIQKQITDLYSDIQKADSGFYTQTKMQMEYLSINFQIDDVDFYTQTEFLF